MIILESSIIELKEELIIILNTMFMQTWKHMHGDYSIRMHASVDNLLRQITNAG